MASSTLAAESNSVVIYQTDFTDGLAAGWSVVDGDSDGATWTSSNPGGRSNPNWRGTFMIVDSDSAGEVEVDMDEELITPSIDCSGYANIRLKFNHYFKKSSREICDVDVRVSGGPWQNAARYQRANASGLVELDLSAIAGCRPDVQIRWHYYNANYAEYWGIDDVEIRGAGSFDDVVRYLAGYFKWLLHLGKNPTDRIISPYHIGSDPLEYFGGQANIMPAAGEIYDFSETWARTIPDLMIWTPQYSADGFFADEPLDDFVQIYHIYIFSPEQREARLRFRYYKRVGAWNNGVKVVHRDSPDGGAEQYEDFLLHEGVNSMTFKLQTPNGDSYFAVRITDRNDAEYTDLTYTLSPPLPAKDLRLRRLLPVDYDPGTNIEVTLSLEVAPEATADELTIIEYIPEGLAVVDAGGGAVIANAIQWSLAGPDLETMDINYSLAVPQSRTAPIAFLGYFYYDKKLEDIFGGSVIFEQEPPSASDMAGSIETIDINAGDYARAENVTVAQTDRVKDYSASLENSGRGLVSGLKPHQTGGWAEYEFSVTNPGEYQIVLDYGELWTMFHNAAEVSVTVDGSSTFETQLFPTTHSYGYGGHAVGYPWEDPERKAKWIVGSVNLSSGSHVLRLIFPSMYPEDVELDRFTDGRPVITKIILTNYPGLTLPYLAEPHHLDSYEHAPARIMHDRDVAVLADGRVEITFYGTFYSLSQGSEIYFASGYVRPRVNQDEAKFEIVSIEPEVFYLPLEGEQDFVLVVRSKEPVPENYSELVVVWLQGTPSSPSRRPYLFTTAQSYITLPPYKRPEFAWSHKPLFGEVQYHSRFVRLDVTDPAVMFIPDRQDLGFDSGRYSRNVTQFFKDQFDVGLLPSVEKIFEHPAWDDYWHVHHQGQLNWAQIWSAILASTYWREDIAPTGPPGRGQVSNTSTKQAKAYVKRLSENMVFYPVTRRWDWTRPQYMPRLTAVGLVKGIPALAAHIRTAQENMIDDNEQFRILHNLVLPIFNSYWDGLRTTAVLTEDVNEGDVHLPISRPYYGDTGCPADGFTWYVKVGGDILRMSSLYTDSIKLREPVSKSYPKGSVVTSWAFHEAFELECKDVISLIAIGASSRDRAVVDEIMHIFSEILNKQKIFMEDGSFKNEPGSYGGSTKGYPEALLKAQRLFGQEALAGVSQETMDKIHGSLIHAYEFPFSNGRVPQLNGGGAMNQMNRGYHGDVRMLEELFPEDIENISLYKRIVEQEQNRVPGDIIDNHNFVIHGWGYAMLRSENGSWDRGMETLLASKYLRSDPGDHVSPDCLGIVIYGLGAILTPRYGYSWVGFVPPCLNQVMVDDDREGNRYYGSFWHFDGRKELPSAVAHTGDGIDSSELPFRRSRWDIQFPEYLFDAYFIEAKDVNEHQYDWCFINMGDLEVVEPNELVWEPYQQFLDGYWPAPGTRGEGERTIASKTPGNVVADWKISNGPWVPYGDETLLRFTPEHGGCLRLIVADDSPGHLINAQIGYYDKPDFFQANSLDILVVRKNAVSHAFVDTLEPIADDEEAYVKDVVVVERGNHNQQLVKVTTAEGQDWVYLSGNWGVRPDGDWPVSSVTTDADMVAWRVINNVVRRVYLAGGSYANTPHGSWDFGSPGNHYSADIDGDGIWDH